MFTLCSAWVLACITVNLALWLPVGSALASRSALLGAFVFEGQSRSVAFFPQWCSWCQVGYTSLEDSLVHVSFRRK